MKLGIFVNTGRHIDAVTGITQAAVKKGHSITIFAMDAGTRLFVNPAFTELCRLDGISISFCDHSAKKEGAVTQGLPAEIVCGSQYNNALMVHESDKVIVL